ncbi:hypothetical protein ACQRIU_006783 [Beauveria bassiana]
MIKRHFINTKSHNIYTVFKYHPRTLVAPLRNTASGEHASARAPTHHQKLPPTLTNSITSYHLISITSITSSPSPPNPLDHFNTTSSSNKHTQFATPPTPSSSPLRPPRHPYRNLSYHSYHLRQNDVTGCLASKPTSLQVNASPVRPPPATMIQSRCHACYMDSADALFDFQSPLSINPIPVALGLNHHRPLSSLH